MRAIVNARVVSVHHDYEDNSMQQSMQRKLLELTRLGQNLIQRRPDVCKYILATRGKSHVLSWSLVSHWVYLPETAPGELFQRNYFECTVRYNKNMGWVPFFSREISLRPGWHQGNFPGELFYRHGV